MNVSSDSNVTVLGALSGSNLLCLTFLSQLNFHRSPRRSVLLSFILLLVNLMHRELITCSSAHGYQTQIFSLGLLVLDSVFSTLRSC